MSRAISQFQATLLAFGAFIMWVFANTCVKLSSEMAVPPYETLGIVGLTGTITITIIAALMGNIKTLWPCRPRSQLIRALIATANVLASIVALKYLPMTTY